MTPSTNKEWPPRYKENLQGGAGSSAGGHKAGEMSSVEASRTTTSSRDVSVSNASDIESEWIEEDEPGVYITIRQLLDGTRELRRVRFRSRFLKHIDSYEPRLIQLLIACWCVSAARNSERCTRSTGGKRTGTGYKLSIFASAFVLTKIHIF